MVSIKLMEQMMKYESSFFKKLPDDLEQHCRRVSIYARILASNIQPPLAKAYPAANMQQILYAVQMGGFYHDIGKVIYAPEILNKKDALTKAEKEAMKSHPIRSAELLMADKDFQKEDLIHKKIVLDACQYHHEWYDGKGYPIRLSKKMIPLVAQIVSTADVFDAMISQRSYKKKMDIDSAIAMIISQSSKQFAPRIVKCVKESYKELGTAIYFMKSNQQNMQAK